MSRQLKLSRLEVNNLNWQYYSTYRLRVEASEPEGDDVDEFIFIFARNVADPYSGASRDDFHAICGPAQLSLPIGDPDPENNYPFYRLNYVELDFTSKQQALEVWEIIKTETRILIEGLGKLTDMDVAEEVVYTDASE